MKHTGFIIAVEPYLLRAGLVSVLNRIPGAVVARECRDAKELMDSLEHLHGEYLLISQALFHEASAVFEARASLLDRTVLVVDSPPENVADAVHSFILSGESREKIHEKISALLDSHTGQSGPQDGPALSEREKTIVRLASMGYTNRQIAEKLFLSSHTVTTHRRNISAKLGIKSLSGLTVYAIVNNIITIEEVSAKADQ